MATVTISAINTAIAETLGAAAGIVSVQDAAQNDDTGLKEGLLDLPAIQVYWQSKETDAAGETDRTTFGAVVRQSRLTFHADVYARQRANLSEDLAAVLMLAEAVDVMLEAQTAALFGLDGIKAFKWRAERVTFDYAGVEYAGARFVIDVRVY